MMKRIAMAIAAGMLMAGAAAADPVEGLWQTQVDDDRYAHVQIAKCGANFCGTIVKTFLKGAEYKSPNLGKQLIRDMAPQGGGAYKGQVWRPSNGKIYNGKLALKGDRLKMSGCVAGGLLCSSQNWTRLK